MNKMAKSKHPAVSPWEDWLHELDTSQIKVGTAQGKKVLKKPISQSPSRSQTKSKPKIRVCRTSMKMTKINLESNENICKSAQKKNRIQSVTPKGLRGVNFAKARQRWSPDLRKGGSIMSIDTWRQESKRLLASMSNKKAGVPLEKSKTTLERKQAETPLLSTIKNASLIYKRPRAEYPNMTRFKLIQWQKNTKP